MTSSNHNNSFVRMSTVAILSSLLGVLALTGCRTMDGAGKDMENAGQAIQDKANNP